MVRAALAVAGMVGLAAAGYWALRLGYADWLARKGEAWAVERAVALDAGNASYRARLGAVEGQLGEDPGKVIPALEAAVALNPAYASGWVELGLRREARGELAQAERCLLEAARMDRTFEPAWALANYHFRRGEAGKFWAWARRAAEMAYGDARPLYRLCWRMTPDAGTILERAVPNRAANLAQYLGFLLADNHLEGAEQAAKRLAETGDREQAGLVLSCCDRLLERGQAEAAVRTWNRLAERGLIRAGRLAPERGESLANATFREDSLGHGFDWRMPGLAGVTITRGERESAVRVAFSGEQPEDCECLWQWAPVMPGRRYRLRFQYRTVQVGRPSGLRWRVLEAGSGAELAPGSPDLAAENWTNGAVDFETRDQTRLIRLSLGYRRASGTTRIEGALWVRDLRLELER